MSDTYFYINPRVGSFALLPQGFPMEKRVDHVGSDGTVLHFYRRDFQGKRVLTHVGSDGKFCTFTMWDLTVCFALLPCGI